MFVSYVFTETNFYSLIFLSLKVYVYPVIGHITTFWSKMDYIYDGSFIRSSWIISKKVVFKVERKSWTRLWTMMLNSLLTLGGLNRQVSACCLPALCCPRLGPSCWGSKRSEVSRKEDHELGPVWPCARTHMHMYTLTHFIFYTSFLLCLFFV